MRTTFDAIMRKHPGKKKRDELIEMNRYDTYEMDNQQILPLLMNSKDSDYAKKELKGGKLMRDGREIG